MRCPIDRTSGYTEEELREHELKTGHTRPTDSIARREWETSAEFPPAPPKRVFTQEELLSALKDSGLIGLAVQEELAMRAEAAAKQQPPAGTPVGGAKK